jgi:hypothetical protein
VFTSKGSTIAGDSSDRSSMRTSTRPVGSFSFTVSGARSTTGPVTVTTLSRRVACAVSKCGLSGVITHCVMPW